MSLSQRIVALDLPLKEKAEMEPDIREAMDFLEKEHGLLPNVLKAYSFDPAKMRPFMQIYNNIMIDESDLTMLEREMIGVVVSSVKHQQLREWSLRLLEGLSPTLPNSSPPWSGA